MTVVDAVNWRKKSVLIERQKPRKLTNFNVIELIIIDSCRFSQAMAFQSIKSTKIFRIYQEFLLVETFLFNLLHIIREKYDNSIKQRRDCE